MKLLKVFFFLTLISLLATSCTGELPEKQASFINFKFSQNWDGTTVTAANFNTLQYSNANGEQLSISKLRYLISKVELHASDRTTLSLKGYFLIDLENDNTINTTFTTVIPDKTYTAITFNFGFDEIDNVFNYTDLNAASWNWPGMLGGGYHNMQLEGQYTNATMTAPNTYAYHMGKARVSTGVFEDNHIAYTFQLNNVTFSTTPSIEIKMNIAEWFKNPNQWDLNTYNNSLMGNYTAQTLMQANGSTAFSLGTVIP